MTFVDQLAIFAAVEKASGVLLASDRTARRASGVRRPLQRADRSQIKIIDIAMDWGSGTWVTSPEITALCSVNRRPKRCDKTVCGQVKGNHLNKGAVIRIFSSKLPMVHKTP